MGDWTKIQKRFDALEARIEFLEAELAKGLAEKLVYETVRTRKGRQPKASASLNEEMDNHAST